MDGDSDDASKPDRGRDDDAKSLIAVAEALRSIEALCATCGPDQAFVFLIVLERVLSAGHVQGFERSTVIERAQAPTPVHAPSRRSATFGPYLLRPRFWATVLVTSAAIGVPAAYAAGVRVHFSIKTGLDVQLGAPSQRPKATSAPQQVTRTSRSSVRSVATQRQNTEPTTRRAGTRVGDDDKIAPQASIGDQTKSAGAATGGAAAPPSAATPDPRRRVGDVGQQKPPHTGGSPAPPDPIVETPTHGPSGGAPAAPNPARP